MGRIYNTQVFNAIIGKNSNYYSDAQYNDLMGQADSMIVQCFCDSAPGTTDVVSVTVQTSNDNLNWETLGSVLQLNVNTANPFPQHAIGNFATNPGGFVRLQITVSTNSTGDVVRVIVCGRTT